MHGMVCDDAGVHFRSDLAEPVPAPGEVVLAVRLAGICDTDLQLARGYMGFRGILGHEFVGIDADGRRVTAEINNACHDCETCRGAGPGHCPHRTVLGILGHDGAMADRVCVPARNLHAIPDGVDNSRAIFIEPLAAAFRIAEQVPLAPGLRMAILGDGKLGTLCAWACRLSGAEVTLIGKHPEKLALVGPGIAVAPKAEADDWRACFDVVADCTGSATGLPDALRLVRPRGTVVLKTTIAGTYAANLAPIVIDEVAVVGSRCGPFPRAVAALTSGEIDPTPLIGAEYPLANGEEAFRAAAVPGARKILLRVG